MAIHALTSISFGSCGGVSLQAVLHGLPIMRHSLRLGSTTQAGMHGLRQPKLAAVLHRVQAERAARTRISRQRTRWDHDRDAGHTILSRTRGIDDDEKSCERYSDLLASADVMST